MTPTLVFVDTNKIKKKRGKCTWILCWMEFWKRNTCENQVILRSHPHWNCQYKYYKTYLACYCSFSKAKCFAFPKSVLWRFWLFFFIKKFFFLKSIVNLMFFFFQINCKLCFFIPVPVWRYLDKTRIM